YIDHRIGVDLQDYTGLHKRSKPSEGRFQPIRSQREVGQNVRSCFVSEGGSYDARVCLGHRYLHTRQHRSTLIRDGTIDLCCRLRPYIYRYEKKNSKNEAPSLHVSPFL